MVWHSVEFRDKVKAKMLQENLDSFQDQLKQLTHSSFC